MIRQFLIHRKAARQLMRCYFWGIFLGTVDIDIYKKYVGAYGRLCNASKRVCTADTGIF